MRGIFYNEKYKEMLMETWKTEKVLPKEVKGMLRRKMLAAALAVGLAGALVLGGCQSSGSKGKTADGKNSVRFMVGGSEIGRAHV